MTGAALASIESVVRNGLCTGCGLCEAIQPKGVIETVLDSEGYLRPAVRRPHDLGAVELFRDVCPGVRVEHAGGEVAHHPLWGPLVAIRAGHATAPEIRRRGASGGVVSALAAHLLEAGEVAFVAQIAVSGDDPLRNDLQLSRSVHDVLRAAGSRYAPSAPLRTLRDLLERGERFAFVGKPCDVAALRRYARHDPRVDELIPYKLSFMCAGVPSILATHELLGSLGVDRATLTSFRYRGDGWPGMARAVTDDGRVFEMDYRRSWGDILGRRLQFRCKICPDGTGEFADVVCADAWYGKDGYPDFAEREGRSLVLSRTSTGEALVRAAVRAGALDVESVSVTDISSMQPYQAHRKTVVLARVWGARLARGRSPRFRNLGLVRASLRAGPLDWLRNAWGTFRRAKGEMS